MWDDGRVVPAGSPAPFSRSMTLDAGADLREVEIAARDADPRITVRYDWARKNIDRHPNCILAAHKASGS